MFLLCCNHFYGRGDTRDGIREHDVLTSIFFLFDGPLGSDSKGFLFFSLLVAECGGIWGAEGKAFLMLRSPRVLARLPPMAVPSVRASCAGKGRPPIRKSFPSVPQILCFRHRRKIKSLRFIRLRFLRSKCLGLRRVVLTSPRLLIGCCRRVVLGSELFL